MGPLDGVRIIEIAGLAPGPFAAMVLSDLGAQVLRVDRVGMPEGQLGAGDLLARGRRSVALDLKVPAGVGTVLRLVESADVLIEGFRPGVAERLGIGPLDCERRNPRLIFGRMTGWGQDGPLAARAGHDINYIALAGALEPIGRAGDRPLAPLNLVGDFGGGGMLLALGIIAALFERERSGRGQVVDAAMVDGAALLATFVYGMRAAGQWSGARGTNLLDSGAPFYDTYRTSDGGFMSVGALEPQFYAALLTGLGLADEELPAQLDPRGWAQLRARFTEIFAGRTRADWTTHFADSDACVFPVLTLEEAPQDPHNRHRGTFVSVDGVVQPAPAPRFSRTPTQVQGPPPKPGQHTDSALAEWGFSAEELAALRREGAIGR